jgi:extradiol dioxygenase family protein
MLAIHARRFAGMIPSVMDLGVAATRLSSPPVCRESFDLVGYHHLQLAIPAGAEDACRRFWAGVVGLAEVAKPPVLAARGGCWFRGAGIEVHLGIEVGTAADFRPAVKAHPGILVRNLDALAARLTEAGATVRWDGDFPGHRHFYSADPVGNRLEFLEPAAG